MLVDDGMTLALAVREGGHQKWTYFTKEQLKQTMKQLEDDVKGKENIADSGSDMDSIIQDNEEAGEDGEEMDQGRGADGEQL